VAGMLLTEDICTDAGACLIPKGTFITEDLEKKVKRFRLKPIEVEIYDDSLSVEEVKGFDKDIKKRRMSDELTGSYVEAKQEVKDILDAINSGKHLDSRNVDNALVNIKENVHDSFDVLKCIDSIRTVDEYTYAHCVNVSLLAMTLARWLGMNNTEVEEIAKAGLLHDIGKAKIDADLLNKNGKLTPEEFEEMKTHTTNGYRMVENMHDISRGVKMGVLMHHERTDGSGYPMGAKGDQIHKYAKVLAIADVYDAMTSDKVYKNRRPAFEVLRYMQGEMANLLDRAMLNTFVERIICHYIGDYVILNTGEIGELVHVNPRYPLKPIVQVQNVFVDLYYEKDVELSDLLWDYSKYMY
jgi:putative nucleotidyltransferase with HDIG domain